MSLVAQPAGGYRFLPGIEPYCCGVVSAPGLEIVHVTLQRPAGWRDGLQQIARFLTQQDRPVAALCGIELRSPQPFSFAGFAEFNAGYAAVLRDWGVFVDGINPVARTNVAPEAHPPAEPVLYGFSFTRPCAADLPPTFVVAGAGELPEGKLSREAIIALGDTSPAGLEQKARLVMDLMEGRLRGLGGDWSQVSHVDVYTVHSLTPFWPEVLLGRMGPAGPQAVHWHFARPPVQEIEFEMDLRGVRTELCWP